MGGATTDHHKVHNRRWFGRERGQSFSSFLEKWELRVGEEGEGGLFGGDKMLGRFV